MSDYEQFLAQIDRLGEVLTMPVAVVESVMIICAVFLTWRMASWMFGKSHNPGRVSEPVPPAPLDLTRVTRAAGWGWGRIRGVPGTKTAGNP